MCLNSPDTSPAIIKQNKNSLDCFFDTFLSSDEFWLCLILQICLCNQLFTEIDDFSINALKYFFYVDILQDSHIRAFLKRFYKLRRERYRLVSDICLSIKTFVFV